MFIYLSQTDKNGELWYKNNNILINNTSQYFGYLSYNAI